MVSYQTAYFKYYYPVEFMAALMTSVIDNTRKVSEYIFTCRQMGIKVLPPDVNEGEGVFTSVGDNIRYGLYAIKSIGRPVVDLILQERTENGTYKTLTKLSWSVFLPGSQQTCGGKPDQSGGG